MTDAAKNPAALAPADKPTDKIPVALGVVPASIDEAWRLASLLARSALVPKDFRNQPENVLLAMQLGAELGLAPMAAIQSIAVINGRPSLWGDGLLGVILASPLHVAHEEYYVVNGRVDADGAVTGGQRRDNLTAPDLDRLTTAAVCVFTRKGQPPKTATFSIAQAKKAGLWGKDGPWQTYPDRMLKMRARGFAARDTYADLLKGLKTAEEIMDTPIEDAPPKPTRAPRLSDTRHDFIDRTADTRQPDPPAADAAFVDATDTDTPEAADARKAAALAAVDHGPATITALDEHIENPEGSRYWSITLDSGAVLETESADHARQLLPYAGSGRRFNFAATADGVLVAWAILPEAPAGDLPF